MKKAKLLTVLGVLLAMGIVACNNQKSEEPKSSDNSTPISQPSEASKTSSDEPVSSPSTPSSSKEDPKPEKDKTGHIWGADADVVGDEEKGLAPYKRAVCSEEDGAVKYTVNQSHFVLASGSTRKSGTPEGYMKLTSDKMSFSFKFNSDKFLKGKVYLYGCMDSYSNNYQKTFCYYNNKPNVELKVNGEAVDVSAQATVTYQDIYGPDSVEGNLSNENYALLGDVVLQKGVNEIVYTRVQTMNTLVKDIVFVGEELDSEWGEPQQVAAAEGSIAYTKTVNNLTGAIKVEWKALDGTMADGSSNKSGTPDGYLKLNSNTNKISYAFNFDADLDGQLYQRGAMDGYPGNASCTYFSQTKGAKYGNFEMKVNDSIVYIGDKRDVKYGDMLGYAAAEGDASIGSGYSEVKDCLIGESFLKNGANTASFERVDSYNLAISYFVFIGQPAAKAHVNPATDAAFSGQDDASHWQAVEGDAFKFNRGEHRLVADTDETDTQSTCTVKGQKHYKCEVCGKKVVEELELKAHTWVSDEDLASTDVASTCTEHGSAHMKCSVCGAKEVQELPLGDHALVDGTAANNSDGFAVTPFECSACHKVGAKMAVDSFTGNTKINSSYKHSNNTTVTYKIIAPKAGSYQLKIGAFVANNRTKDLSVAPYTVKVGEGDAAVNVPVSSGTYEELGIGTSTAKQFVLCPTITLIEGENVIALSQGGGGFRLTFQGLVEIYEL